MSTGADTKAHTRELVRSPGGLLQRAQHRVTLEALRESRSSFGTEIVVRETASTRTEVGAEWCQLALTRKQPLGRQAPVRATGSLLELFQRRVALQPVSESGSSLGAEVVLLQTASTGKRRVVMRRVKGR